MPEYESLLSKREKVFLSLLVLSLVANVLMWQFISQSESMKMLLGRTIIEKVFYAQHITGYASKDEFFCVWVKDRSYSDIMQTCNHEYFHTEYFRNWEHFTNVTC